MMLDKITNYEKEMIDFYRKSYVGELQENPNEFCSTDHFLRNWAREKGWLYRMFGENLTLSRTVSYSTPYAKIFSEIERVMYDDEKNVMYTFLRHFREKVDMYFYGREGGWGPINERSYCKYETSMYGNKNLVDEQFDIYECLSNLISTVSLAKTTYQYRTLKKAVMPKTGKIISLVQYETKIMRVISALVDELDLDKDLFESFRIRHSKFFNQSKLEGELCISIHPLDYITMSENSFNWKSCMNWRENGCYRRGTVEMMNSDCVVVAYLKNPTKPFTFGNDYSWNNKMWRMLFVVNEDLITGIKGYPYNHDQITQDVICWLRDLVCANGNPNYTSTQTPNSLEFMGSDWCVEMETNAMYNDFGCTENAEHWVIFGENISRGVVNYSGYSECVWCGDDEYASQDESNLFACSQEDLACKNCSVYVGYCGDCGSRLRVGEMHIYNGLYGEYVYCDNCYADHVKTCPITGEVGLDNEVGSNDMVWVHVTKSDDRHWGYGWVLVVKDCWNTHREKWIEVFGDQMPTQWVSSWGSTNHNKRRVIFEKIPKSSYKLLNLVI